MQENINCHSFYIYGIQIRLKMPDKMTEWLQCNDVPLCQMVNQIISIDID